MPVSVFMPVCRLTYMQTMVCTQSSAAAAQAELCMLMFDLQAHT